MRSDNGRCRFAGWVIDSEFPLVDLPASFDDADWRVIGDASVFRQRQCEWYQQFHPSDGLPWIWYGRSGQDDVLRIWGLGLVVIRHASREIACLFRRHLGPGEHEHLLVNHILPLLASAHGYLVLHASVVVRPSGGAIALVGPVGAGKSTLAGFLASRGWRLLSDDRLILDAGSLAWPVAPYVRVSTGVAAKLGIDAVLPEGHHKVRLRFGDDRGGLRSGVGVPIERAVLLQTGPGPVRFSPLAPIDAVSELLGEALQLGLDAPTTQSAAFNAVVDLVAAVPCTRLTRPRQWESLAAAEALLQQPA